jgi:hypothetical protein
MRARMRRPARTAGSEMAASPGAASTRSNGGTRMRVRCESATTAAATATGCSSGGASAPHASTAGARASSRRKTAPSRAARAERASPKIVCGEKLAKLTNSARSASSRACPARSASC